MKKKKQTDRVPLRKLVEQFSKDVERVSSISSNMEEYLDRGEYDSFLTVKDGATIIETTDPDCEVCSSQTLEEALEFYLDDLDDKKCAVLLSTFERCIQRIRAYMDRPTARMVGGGFKSR